jgi:hypothetical protein
MLVGCVGRGGDKSRTSVLMALAETLGGDHKIPPGERHYFTHVSENVSEATKTIGLLEQYLGFLGVHYDRSGDAIDLRGIRKGFRVLACRVGAVSGWRSYGWTADEAAKWSNDGVDPSAEVIASIKAMSVTHPGARGRMFSSPLGSYGHFYDAWAMGDTATQLAAHAATWAANPGVTEAQTRELEVDPRVHAREYGAIPQAGISACFDAIQIADAEARAIDPDAPRAECVVIIDAASGGKDLFSWAVARRARLLSGTDGIRLETADGVDTRSMTSEAIVAQIARVAHDAGARAIHGDQRDALALGALFRQCGLTFHQHVWTSESKPRAVETVRRWFRDGTLSLEPHAQMRRELLLFEERISPGGSFTFGSRAHDDFVAILLTCALAADGLPRVPRFGGGGGRRRFSRRSGGSTFFDGYVSPFDDGHGPNGVSAETLNTFLNHRLVRGGR